VGRELVQDVDQVVQDQPVAVPAPPVPYHPAGQDDEVLGLLASVDDDPPEVVWSIRAIPAAPCGSFASRPPVPIG
jgi:hypothetical protein